MAQPVDGHGNVFNTATDRPLGSSIAGNNRPSIDRYIFRLNLSGASGPTDVWIYTASEADAVVEI